MKLIPTGIMAVSLAAGTLLLTPGHVQAQATKLTLTLTGTYQDPNPKQPPASNPNITPSDTKSGKITSANILTLLGGTVTIPSGSYLSYDPDFAGGTGAIGALDKAGDFEDLSAELTITSDASGNGVLTSSSNADPSDPIAQSTVYTSDWVIAFDDGNGNTFNISGVIKTTASLAKGDAAGDPQTETITYSGSVSGWGSYMGNNAVFTGTISGTGKGPQGS